MDKGTLVYSNTGVTSAANTISIGRHTSSIYFLNLSSTDNATVQLNDKFDVMIGHTPNQAIFRYTEIPGDYTTFKILTANVTLSVYAIG